MGRGRGVEMSYDKWEEDPTHSFNVRVYRGLRYGVGRDPFSSPSTVFVSSSLYPPSARARVCVYVCVRVCVCVYVSRLRPTRRDRVSRGTIVRSLDGPQPTRPTPPTPTETPRSVVPRRLGCPTPTLTFSSKEGRIGVHHRPHPRPGYPDR